jgi:hypothetical protein
MSINTIIAEYESRLSKLRDWPDGAVIHELTAFAVRNDHIANHIADILVSRIIDVRKFSHRLVIYKRHWYSPTRILPSKFLCFIC